jgi:NADH-quinone oxidoreductase subunit L
VVAGMTAFYMFRLYHMTFSGTFRGTEHQAHHLHESPKSMVVPLQVLAVGSIVAGFLGVPAVLGGALGIPNTLEHFLEPVFESANHTLFGAHGDGGVFTHLAHGTGLELGLMAASIAVALVGIALATRFYKTRPEIAEAMARAFAPIHRLLLNKYYVDELYGAVFVRGLSLGGGKALFACDRFVVDGADGEVRRGFGVNGLAWLARDIVARVSNFWDRVAVDGLVNLLADVLDNLSYAFRAVQNGLVQHYALGMLIGLFLLLAAGRWVLGAY